MIRFPTPATSEGLSAFPESSEVLPIACRFVSTDQWLVTHIQVSWTIAQVKDWLVAKFIVPAAGVRPVPHRPARRRRRPASPLTFATGHVHSRQEPGSPTVYSGDAEDEFDSLDELSDDLHVKYKYTRKARQFDTAVSPPVPGRVLSNPPSRTSLSDAGGPAGTTRFTLVSFSSGQLLEDHFNLGWYSLHPFELLELYAQPEQAMLRPDRIISLPRGHLEEYIRPFLETRVRFVRLDGVDADSFGLYKTNTGPAFNHERDPGTRKEGSVATTSVDAHPRGLRHGAKRKKKVGWRERWLVVHEGYVRIYKDRNDAHPMLEAPLSALLSLRGGEDVQPDILQSLHAKSKNHSTATPFASPGSSPPPVSPFSSPPVGPYQPPIFGGRRCADGPTDPGRLICAQFRLGARPFGTRERDHISVSDGASVGTGGWWRRTHRDTPGAGPSHGFGDYFGMRKAGYTECHSEDDLHETEKSQDPVKPRLSTEDSVWFVLDVLSESTHDNLLRVLHREAPQTCSSTFVHRSQRAMERDASLDQDSEVSDTLASFGLSPTTVTNPINFPPAVNISPPQLSLSSGYIASTTTTTSTLEAPSRGGSLDNPIATSMSLVSFVYPDWRMFIVRRARKAGLGSVGRAKELVMFGADGAEQLSTDQSEIRTRATKTPRIEYAPDIVGPMELDSPKHEGINLAADSELDQSLSDDSESSSLSELGDSEHEWDGWMQSLLRQRSHQEQDTRGRTRAVPSPSAAEDSGDEVQYLQDNGLGLYNPKGKFKPVDIPRPIPTPRTLSSYASVDSLFRRTIHRQMSQQLPADPRSVPEHPLKAVEFMHERRTRSSTPSSPLAITRLDVGPDIRQMSRSDSGHDRLVHHASEPGMLRLPSRLPILSMTPIDQPTVSLDDDAPVPPSSSRKGKDRERRHATMPDVGIAQEGRRRKKNTKKSSTLEDSRGKQRKKRKDTTALPFNFADSVPTGAAGGSRPGIELPRPALNLSSAHALSVEASIASSSSWSSGSIRFAAPCVSD
ncbi:hypothetical protein CERSUDRAFT_119785 [Gelatoporia subvermispora B]|uniref:PH domain-containing protein n=1 Tax=Ceriporiopsis subvermispora (strain B) TaxID=914234 RepID=M2P7U3_CERS8|nr:hypothetical protein CERSUDRAFT_119785 [Gelatoporia subvermispora B]